MEFAIDDVVEHQHKTLIRAVGQVEGMKPTSEETTRFYVGMLHDGVPLPGGTGKRLMEYEIDVWYRHDTQLSEKGPPFPRKWLSYLSRTALILVTSENLTMTPMFYRITPFGVEFLNYVSAQGLDHVERPF